MWPILATLMALSAVTSTSLMGRTPHLHPPVDLPPPSTTSAGRYTSMTMSLDELRQTVALAQDTVSGVMSRLFDDDEDNETPPEDYPDHQMSASAMLAEETSRLIARKYQLAPEQVSHALPTIDVRLTPLSSRCPLTLDVPCRPRRFRAFSAHCNNVQNPRWGAAHTRLLRMLPSQYDDGVSSAQRKGASGSPLPSPLVIAEKMLQIKSRRSRHPYVSVMTTAWAKLIALDVASVSPTTWKFNCCSNATDVASIHPECLPVVEEDQCVNYVRSRVSPRVGCTLGPREQANSATSFIDASALYTASKADAFRMRQQRGGRIKTVPNYAVSSELNAILEILSREHNRVADVLSTLNRHWDDERLFQEARRYIGAVIQHITYNEFLPILLGQRVMDTYGLRPQSTGFFSGYDIDMNAGVTNAAIVGALHGFIAATSPTDLDDNSSTETTVQTLLQKHAMRGDTVISENMDEMSLLIQRGRDHGLPPYMTWRAMCSESSSGVATNFTHLRGMNTRALSALRDAYASPSDVDAIVGFASELSMPGAFLGPTSACLLGRTFHSLRRGDRHWYENDMPPSAFTSRQLHEIRKVSLARLICDNAGIMMVQPNAFLIPDEFLNAPLSCLGSSLARADLTAWKTSSPSLSLSQEALREAVAEGRVRLSALQSREAELSQSADPQSPVGTASAFNRPKRQALQVANTSLLLQFASDSVLKAITGLQDRESPASSQDDTSTLRARAVEALSTIWLPAELISVPRVFPCDEHTLPCDHTTKFRTSTGWCNNLQHPEWGKALRTFRRLASPVYHDALGKPRQVSLSGRPLPSARLVSRSVHHNVFASSLPAHRRYTLMIMQFAQLLDHDITHTPINRGIGDTVLNCRRCDAASTVHPECWPIPIPEDDSFFVKANNDSEGECLPFTRSLPGQLTLGRREQINQVSAFVDASHTYGSDVCEARSLRTQRAGRLNITLTRSPTRQMMPQISTHKECKSTSGLCFQAGDMRASEQPGLAVIHTLFLREHNRIAGVFSSLNPQWDDERIYQEARRVVSAVMQHITYSELLPRLLGREAIKKYDLDVLRDGYFHGYDSNCDPTIANEVASAAFRFGHSLLSPVLRRFDARHRNLEPPVRLRDTFFNPDVLLDQPHLMDEIIRGLVGTPMEPLDRFITEEVTNHLFELRGKPHSGMDLAALNVQRARDHGIPGYSTYRTLCNLSAVSNWSDVDLIFSATPGASQAMNQLYDSVDDIDLFPAAMAEIPPDGALVGSTFACIIGEQFQRLKKCDRFWYETSDPMIRFSEAQLDSVRRSSLASLVCDNGDDIRDITRNTFDLPDAFLNPRIPCSAVPRIDLTLWKERRSCSVSDVSIEIGGAERISPCVMCTCTTEGPLCQSVQVTDCMSLVAAYGTSPVLADAVCKVQCAHTFFHALRNEDEEREEDYDIDNQLGFT